MAVPIINNHSSISLIDLDFDGIKASLLNYLRNNDQFKDYDFEASNINLLVELLAYNAYKTAFYQNMTLNESFLDSALLRTSVLSRCKELNYLPRSYRSTKARVLIQFEATGESAPYIIEKGSPLTALVKSQAYTFTVPETITVASSNTTYSVETDIYEGVYIKDTYTFLSNDNIPRYKITNKNIDTSSLVVSVYEDGNEFADIYTYASSLLDIESTSKVYFLQPSQDGYYEVLFGDNNLGRKPKENSTIVLDYRVSSGFVSNGAREFTLDFDPTGEDEVTSIIDVITLQSGNDGDEYETIDSIKFTAPRHFQTQERAVTASDYAIALKAQFPEINAVYAYGGEDLSPPRYGRVYCAIDITNVDGLPESKKIQYYNFLKNRTTFGIIPTFVEPDYTYLQVNSTIRYNVNITSASSETIKSYVKDAVIGFRDTYLDDFDVILRHSKLETAIDNADPSIVSSVTDVLAYKKINPKLDNSLQEFTLNFGVAFRTDIPPIPGTHDQEYLSVVRSTQFTYENEFASLEDDGQGTLRIVREVGGIHDTIVEIGTVDYENGIVSIKDIRIEAYLGPAIKIFVRPKDPDVVSNLNNILTIEEDEINIIPEELRL
jgi:hypothetical protein